MALVFQEAFEVLVQNDDMLIMICNVPFHDALKFTRESPIEFHATHFMHMNE